MFSGACFFALTDALAKWLTASLPFIQLGWLRSITGVLLIGLFMLVSGNLHTLKSSRPGWHLFRGVFGTLAVILNIYSLGHIPLAEFTAIVFSQPFFIAILSAIVLKEKINKQSWAAIIIGFVGILFVARPSPDHFQIAHIAALFASLSFAIMSVTARYLSNSESVFALNFYVYPMNIILSFYWATSSWVAPSLNEWFLIVAMGFAATVAFGCVVQAMRYARAAVVAPIDYTRLIWAGVLGYYFWHELPDLYTCIGVLFILGSGMFILRQIRHSR